MKYILTFLTLLTSVAFGQFVPMAKQDASNIDAAVWKLKLQLSNVDNTSDANKPVSTATQSALDLKANLTGSNLSLSDRTAFKTVLDLNNVANTKHNLFATVPPLPEDDAVDGYTLGSMWFDYVLDEAWWCADNSIGEAVWQKIATPAGVLASATSDGATNPEKILKTDNEGKVSVSTLGAGTINANGITDLAGTGAPLLSNGLLLGAENTVRFHSTGSLDVFDGSSAFMTSVDPSSRTLNDTAGAVSAYWGGTGPNGNSYQLELPEGSNMAVKFISGPVAGGSGPYIDFDNGWLSGFQTSIKWIDRQAFNANGELIADWSGTTNSGATAIELATGVSIAADYLISRGGSAINIVDLSAGDLISGSSGTTTIDWNYSALQRGSTILASWGGNLGNPTNAFCAFQGFTSTDEFDATEKAAEFPLGVEITGPVDFMTPKWDDLRFPAQAINPSGAANAPTVSNSTGMLEFSGTTDNVIAGQAQMPHSWSLGSEIRPHIHLVFPTANANSTRWKFEYTLIAANGSSSNPYGTYTDGGTITIANPNAASQSVIQGWTGIDMTGYTASCTILWRISRLSASDAIDDDTSISVLTEFDIHYQMDKIGSEEEFPTP